MGGEIGWLTSAPCPKLENFQMHITSLILVRFCPGKNWGELYKKTFPMTSLLPLYLVYLIIQKCGDRRLYCSTGLIFWLVLLKWEYRESESKKPPSLRLVVEYIIKYL